LRELRWSDFEWFKKKSKVHFDNTYFICSEKNGVDQKVIIPLNKLGKHLTASLSHKYLDIHVTNDNRAIPQRNIVEIRFRKANKMIQKSRKPNDVMFIPFRDKSLKKMVLVNPYTKEFIKNVHRMDEYNIFPTTLNKTRIRSMRNNHGRILVAYDFFGRFKGILKCDHHKSGFNFIPAGLITEIERKLVDSLEIKNRLREEGLKENVHYRLFWQRWYKVINILESLQKPIFHLKCLLKYIHSIYGRKYQN